MQVISGEANGNQMATLMSSGEEKQDLDLEGSVWLSQSRDFKDSHEAGKLEVRDWEWILLSWERWGAKEG